MILLSHFLLVVFLKIFMNFFLATSKTKMISYLETPFFSDCLMSFDTYINQPEAPSCAPPDSDHSGRSITTQRSSAAICLFFKEAFFEKDVFTKDFYYYWKKKCKKNP